MLFCQRLQKLVPTTRALCSGCRESEMSLERCRGWKDYVRFNARLVFTLVSHLWTSISLCVEESSSGFQIPVCKALLTDTIHTYTSVSLSLSHALRSLKRHFNVNSDIYCCSSQRKTPTLWCGRDTLCCFRSESWGSLYFQAVLIGLALRFGRTAVSLFNVT